MVSTSTTPDLRVRSTHPCKVRKGGAHYTVTAREILPRAGEGARVQDDALERVETFSQCFAQDDRVSRHCAGRPLNSGFGSGGDVLTFSRVFAVTLSRDYGQRHPLLIVERVN